MRVDPSRRRTAAIAGNAVAMQAMNAMARAASRSVFSSASGRRWLLIDAGNVATFGFAGFRKGIEGRFDVYAGLTEILSDAQDAVVMIIFRDWRTSGFRASSISRCASTAVRRGDRNALHLAEFGLCTDDRIGTLRTARYPNTPDAIQPATGQRTNAPNRVTMQFLHTLSCEGQSWIAAVELSFCTAHSDCVKEREKGD